jgi:TRAP-type mannitol/chloroaromatic compound transport system permease small subunit
MGSFLNRLEGFCRGIGYLLAWLTVAMVIVTTVIVIERYWFETGSIRLQESVTYMHAAVLLLAAAYTLAAGDHVRVDIFYGRFSRTGKAWVNLVGTLVLLMPFCLFMIAYSWDYVALSWQIRETSQEAGGLPFPFPSVMKAFIPVAALLLLLQGIVIMGRALSVLRGGDSQ